MRDRYRVKVSGRADRDLVHWLEAMIGLLRALPEGWHANVELERDRDPPDTVEDS